MEQQKMESNSVLLKHIYAKPFMRYEGKVLASQKEQFFIIYEESIIFKRKLIAFMNFFYAYAKALDEEINYNPDQEDNWHDLYDDIGDSLKLKFNSMIKELIDLIYEVSNIFMDEFQENPEKIGKCLTYVLNLIFRD